MKKVLVLAVVLCLVFGMNVGVQAKAKTLRYGHMNAPDATGGIMADSFAKLVEEKTNGELKVQVYPSSQLGSLQEQVEMVAAGTMAFHHTTWGALSALMEEFGAFDTPFLVTNVEDLLKVIDPYTSPIMKRLNEKLIAEKGVRILFSNYGGTRTLTCNKAVYTPDDLQGEKIRCIPFPVFVTAVKGLGAIPTPIDWADVPTALATGTVLGQENPVNLIYNNKFYETQKYLVLTNHLIGSGPCMINEKAWQGLTPEQQEALVEVSKEVAAMITQKTLDETADYTQKLADAGMTVIGPDDGLRIDLFKESTDKVVDETFGEKFGELYKEINDYLGK